MRRLGDGVVRLLLLLCVIFFLVGIARAADKKNAAGRDTGKKHATLKVKVLRWGCRWYEQEGRPRCSEQVGIVGDADEEHYQVFYVNALTGKQSRMTTVLKEDIQTRGCPKPAWIMDWYMPPSESVQERSATAQRTGRPRQ